MATKSLPFELRLAEGRKTYSARFKHPITKRGSSLPHVKKTLKELRRELGSSTGRPSTERPSPVPPEDPQTLPRR